jgi:hypothetical protein
MENGEKCAFGFEGLTSLAEGLTKREYFAGLAMQGVLSHNSKYSPTPNQAADIAMYAVKIADALLEELDKTK